MATTVTTVTKATPGSSSVRRVAVLLPPRAPPSRLWRRRRRLVGVAQGVSSRLARAALELGLPHHWDGDDDKNDGDVVM